MPATTDTATDDRLPPFFGPEYGWDRISDVKWDMLRHNHKCMLNVLSNPKRYPRARIADVQAHVDAIEELFACHAQIL